MTGTQIKTQKLMKKQGDIGAVQLDHSQVRRRRREMSLEQRGKVLAKVHNNEQKTKENKEMYPSM